MRARQRTPRSYLHEHDDVADHKVHGQVGGGGQLLALDEAAQQVEGVACAGFASRQWGVQADVGVLGAEHGVCLLDLLLLGCFGRTSKVALHSQAPLAGCARCLRAGRRPERPKQSWCITCARLLTQEPLSQKPDAESFGAAILCTVSSGWISSTSHGCTTAMCLNRHGRGFAAA